MPSRLGFARTPGSRRFQERQSLRLVPQRISLASPWFGFIPDINPLLLSLDAAEDWLGLVVLGEELTTDSGFELVAGSTTDGLPLGHDVDNPGTLFDEATEDGGGGSATTITDSTKSWGTNEWTTQTYYAWCTAGANVGEAREITANTGTTLTVNAFSNNINNGDTFEIVSAIGLPKIDAGSDIVQPVVRIDRYQRITAAGGVQGTDTVAIVAQNSSPASSGTPPPDFGEASHLFRKDGSGDWSGIKFTSFNGDNNNAGPADGATHPTTTVDDLPDAVVYVPGVPGETYTSGGNDLKARPVEESVYIWTDNVGGVYYYPDHRESGAVSNEFTDWNSYAEQLDLIANTASGVRPDFTTFKSNSLCVHQGRVLYFNTEEGGERFSGRVRWSVIGNPFIVWPGYSSNATDGLNGVGAGFLDLNDFGTEGLRILPLGPSTVACYFKDGVTLLRRQTLPTAAYTPQVLTRVRGLVAKHALVDLGGGVHFGIFTDGWYLLDSSGIWREVGLIGEDQASRLASALQGNTAVGTVAYKWKDFFYRNLNQSAVGKLSVGYDAVLKLVRIAWASGTSTANNEVWVYDPQSDRVFPDRYAGVRVSGSTLDVSPLCWASVNRQLSVAESWDSDPASWDSDSESWDDEAASFSELAPLHGDAQGRVYVHDREIMNKADSLPVWFLETHAHAFGAPFTQKTLDRVWVNYGKTAQAVAVAVRAEGYSNAGAGSGGSSFDLSKGSEGNPAVDHADFHLDGHHHKLRFVGIGRPRIRQLVAQFLVEEGRGVGDEPNRGEGE